MRAGVREPARDGEASGQALAGSFPRLGFQGEPYEDLGQQWPHTEAVAAGRGPQPAVHCGRWGEETPSFLLPLHVGGTSLGAEKEPRGCGLEGASPSWRMTSRAETGLERQVRAVRAVEGQMRLRALRWHQADGAEKAHGR